MVGIGRLVCHFRFETEFTISKFILKFSSRVGQVIDVKVVTPKVMAKDQKNNKTIDFCFPKT